MRALYSRPSSTSSTSGLATSNSPGAGSPANGEQAWQKFWAPTGASAVNLTSTGGFWRPGSSEPGADDCQAEIADLRVGARLDGCVARGGSRCVQWHTGRSIAVPNEPGVAL